jgi:hypothetical protein
MVYADYQAGAAARQGGTMDVTHGIPQSENTAWGFYGTMGERAEEAWPIAVKAVAEATGREFEDVRAFLDARHGRHFANEVVGLAAGRELEDAIHVAARRWMAFKVGRRTSRDYDIPRGVPYLVGMVVSYGIAAEPEWRPSAWRCCGQGPGAEVGEPERQPLRGGLDSTAAICERRGRTDAHRRNRVSGEPLPLSASTVTLFES